MPRPGLDPAAARDVVADEAHLLDDAQRIGIEDRIQDVLRRGGVQLCVLTLADARGRAPKSIAVDTLNAWNAGQNSALLLVCLSPRQLFVQPGTALAVALDEPTASAICRDRIAPLMRSSNPAGAIRAGVDAIAERLGVGAAPANGGAGTVRLAPGPSAPADPGPARPLAPSGPTAPARSTTSTTLESIGSTLAGLAFFALLAGGGVSLIFAIVWVVRALSRKCPYCQQVLTSRSRTISSATYFSSGMGETVYTCAPCNFRDVVPYTIAMLSDTSSSSSWDSSSSSSSFDSGSSSSSSSDGSGGGGSSW